MTLIPRVGLRYTGGAVGRFLEQLDRALVDGKFDRGGVDNSVNRRGYCHEEN